MWNLKMGIIPPIGFHVEFNPIQSLRHHETKRITTTSNGGGGAGRAGSATNSVTQGCILLLLVLLLGIVVNHYICISCSSSLCTATSDGRLQLLMGSLEIYSHRLSLLLVI